MENFDDFENKSYVRANRVNYRLADLLRFALNFLSILVRIAGIVAYELLEKLVNLFKNLPPKDISGQLALVTGSAT